MRYERVQEILSNDPALSSLLGPRNHPVPSRFGENIMFSKETVEVTNAIHSEGKDAHKVSKNEVLKAASRILKFVPNGEFRAAVPPATPVAMVQSPPPPTPSTPPAAEKKSQKPKSKAKPKSPETATPKSAEAVAPAPATKSTKPKAPVPTKPEPVKTKPKEAIAAKAIKVVSNTKTKKAETAERSSVAPQRSTPESSNEAEPEADLPECELPPEKQPLHLPAAYDPKKYPHYDVQSSAYSMLLSTLTLVTHYERYPGYEERQKELEAVLEKYLVTCNQIKIG